MRRGAREDGTGALRPRPAGATGICFMFAVLAWGSVLYSHSVYMDTLMQLHGWSASLISSAVFVFWIASLPGTLSVGVLVDRYGPPPVFAIGGLCIGGSLIALGQANAPWQLFVTYGVMGFGYPAMAAAAISATLVPWYERGFGVALGVALTGASIGGATVPVLIVQNSATSGFATTMTMTGLILLAVVFVAVILLAVIGRPHEGGGADRPLIPFSMGAVARRPLFWKISAGVALGLGGQVGFLSHQVPIIIPVADRLFASLMVTVVAVAAAVGRLGIGLLSRFLPVSRLTAISYLLHGTGIAMVALAETKAMIIAGCAVAGLVVGAIVMLPPIIVREAFGSAGYGRTYAMVNVAMYTVAAVCPWVVGLLRDSTGGYGAGLALLVVMEVAGAALILYAMRSLPQHTPVS